LIGKTDYPVKDVAEKGTVKSRWCSPGPLPRIA